MKLKMNVPYQIYNEPCVHYVFICAKNAHEHANSIIYFFATITLLNISLKKKSIKY